MGKARQRPAACAAVLTSSSKRSAGKKAAPCARDDLLATLSEWLHALPPREKEAQRLLDHALKAQFKNDAELTFMLAELLATASDPEVADARRALTLLDRSVSSRPNGCTERYFLLAQLLVDAGRARDAVAAYALGVDRTTEQLKLEEDAEQAADLRRMAARACAAVAELYMTDLAFEPEAQKAATEAVEKGRGFDPLCLDNLCACAALQVVLEDWDNARATCRKGLEVLDALLPQTSLRAPLFGQSTEQLLPPELPQRISFAATLTNAGLAAEAKRVVRAVLEENSQLPEAWHVLALACLADSDASGAENAVANLQELLETARDAEAPQEFLDSWNRSCKNLQAIVDGLPK